MLLSLMSAEALDAAGGFMEAPVGEAVTCLCTSHLGLVSPKKSVSQSLCDFKYI